MKTIEQLRHIAECLGCPDCKGIAANEPCDDYRETPRNFCGRCGLSPRWHISRVQTLADGWAREIQQLHVDLYWRENELRQRETELHQLRARIAAEAGTV